KDISSVATGAHFSVSYCLIGDITGNNVTTYGAGNIFNVPSVPALLGPLGNNGGSTPSFMPFANGLPVGSAGTVTTINTAIPTLTASTISVASGSVFAASSIVPQISFVTGPSNTTAGAPMSPVTVRVSVPVDFVEYIQIDNEIMQIVG